ncbi:MAG: UDP-2,3-diacylglucosamine diphosphatase, partial [Burkholderiales bacterium]
MTRPILFASDIHLAADRPAIVELFLRFLREVAIDAQSLYLLGDVFEYWVGDDDASDHVAALVLDALADLANAGVEVAFMAGN